MIEINLVPDVKQELIKAIKARSTVITFSILIGAISIAVVAILAVYVYGGQTAQNLILDSQITKSGEKLAGVEDLSKTLTIQNQLSKITDLNSSKKIDSRVFDVLTAIIPPSPNDIQISNLLLDSDAGTITIDGQAANSYAAVEVFKKTIEGAKVNYKIDGDSESKSVDLATNISTSNTSYGEDSSGIKVLRFTLSFAYATELLSPSSKGVTITVDTNGDVTDSYLGIPKTIFVERASDITEGQ